MIKSAAFLLLMAGATTAGPAKMSVGELKRLYLGCERRAQSGHLPGADAASCSEAYEELKLRAFGGDFHRLKAWYDLARAAANSGHPNS